jgi:Zn-dependent M16 (insulinase) family peptidase
MNYLSSERRKPMPSYTKESSRFLNDINSEVTVYKHNRTGAHVCCISNDDSNKVFCIGFRTPAKDSTGLTHILEHSVLCGSKKFPVKDPFLELIKGSLNTFLNAMTYPDKTVYPCASQNDKDFKNLMSVYTDAVFYPNIYSRKQIFRQEGWRYELFKPEDPIALNGVVYNEMKGAFSSPDDILFRTFLNALFPDNCYQFESGGNPDNIPELSYEDFLGFHKKYYSPSNAYIYLYGNCDMEERMKWLDENYLSKFEKIDFDTSINREPDFKTLKIVKDVYPIGNQETLKNKTMFAFGFALKNGFDQKKHIAIDILDDILINDPGAPLKKALLDAGVGESVEVSFDTGLVQPINLMVVKNTDSDKAEKLVNIYKEQIESLIAGKLDRKAIVSHLNNYEFKIREASFKGYPKGLDYILNSFSTWLYDDKNPYDSLDVLKLFPELRKDVENGYFEDVLREVFLGNNHSALVELAPSKTIQGEKEAELHKKLADLKASMSPKQIADLIKESNDLRKYQAELSTKEELSTIPRLKKEDLTDKPKDYPSTVVKKDFVSYIQSYKTNGIDYCRYYFDITGLPNKYIPYAALLSDVLFNIRTDKRSESELNSLLLSKVGTVKAHLRVGKKKGNEDNFLFFIDFSLLDANMKEVEDLIEEVVHKTDFSDEKKIYELICTLRNDQISSIPYYGHRVAAERAKAHMSALGYIKDLSGGIGYCDFLSDLASNYQSKKKEIAEMLQETSDIIFAKSRFFSYFTGEESGRVLFAESAEKFYSGLGEGKKPEGVFTYVPDFKSEGIRAPFDVVFVAKSGDYFKAGASYKGDLQTLNNAIDNDYLWMKVRVKGGAYGCFLNISREGQTFMASYRDPNLKSTVEVFNQLPEFIEDMKYSDEELLLFKIGALSNTNPVLHVSDQGSQGFLRAYTGITYEDILKEQDELINASLSDLKAYADVFRRTYEKAPLVVLGNGGLIDKEKDLFTEIRDLNQK